MAGLSENDRSFVRKGVFFRAHADELSRGRRRTTSRAPAVGATGAYYGFSWVPVVVSTSSLVEIVGCSALALEVC